MVQLTPWGGVTVATGLAALPLAWVAWRQRDAAGGAPLAVFLVAVSVGQFAYALHLGSPTVGAKYVWYRLAILFNSVTTLVWVVVALEVSGRDRWLTRRTLGAIAGLPVVLGVLLFVPWTSQWAGTLPATTTVGPITDDGYELGVLMVPIFSIALVGLVSATGVFVHLFIRARHLYRTQAVAVLAAAALPWVPQVLQLWSVFPDRDFTAQMLLLAAGFLTVTLTRSTSLDPVPAAHEFVVESMSDGVVILDTDGRLYDCNPTALTLLGADSVADVRGDAIADAFDEWADLDTDAGGWQQLSVVVDGHQRYLEVRTDRFRDHRDDVVGQLVECRDVTERETRERTLEQFRTVFLTVDDPVYVLDGDGRFALVNSSFAEAVGYEESELRDRPFGMVTAAGAVPEPGTTVELLLESAAGERRPVETRRTRIETRFEGLEGGSVGVLRDISERKRVEAALSKTTERYETLVGASPLAIVAIDVDGRIERWNPAAEEMFGWPTQAVEGERLPIAPADEADRLATLEQRVLDGYQQTNTEFVLERADGSRFDASLSVAPIFGPDEEIVGAVVVVADASERKARERRLERQNERLEEFASVVSHDLRNPLSVADGHVELARETGELDHLERATEAHERMNRLIEELLSLARDGADIEEPDRVSLSAVVDDAWSTTAADAVAFDRLDELGTAEGDPSRLRSLFENLFRNVEDHCGPGTTITVGRLPDRDGFFVADDGPGVPEAVRDRVFESGYTTADSGTGIGLSTVKTIADAHNWSVNLTTSASGGARFEFETGPFGERHDAAPNRSFSDDTS